MKGRVLALIFAVGCIIFFVAFAIGWANWGEFAKLIGIMQVFMGALAVVVTIIITMGALSRGKERWTAMTLGAILLLGFSALTFFSVGWLIAPVALIFLGFSLWRLRRNRTKGSMPINSLVS